MDHRVDLDMLRLRDPNMKHTLLVASALTLPFLSSCVDDGRHPTLPAAAPPASVSTAPPADDASRLFAAVREQFAAAKKSGADIDTPDEFTQAMSELQLGEQAISARQSDVAIKHFETARAVLAKATAMVAEVTTAMKDATADAELAVALGLRESSWDLVRIAHEDIAASKASFDNHEFEAAKKLATGASKDLREEIAKALTGLIAQAHTTLAQQTDLPPERKASTEEHLRAAGAAMHKLDFHAAKARLDKAQTTGQ